MGKEVITVPNAPKLPFSPAIRAGDYIFVSGQVGFIDAGGKEVKGIEAQTRQCLENIKQVLEAAGSSLNEVVTVVTGLVISNMLIEIECIAYSPYKRA